MTPSPTLAHLLIKCSLETTERVLLKVHATRLATGKNTSLLGMPDQIGMEIYTYLSLVCKGPQPSVDIGCGSSAEEDDSYCVLSFDYTEALGEKWPER